MTALWMAWTVLVAALVALAGRALEEAAHLLRLPLRWVWAGALALSAAAPLVAHIALRRAAADTGASLAVEVGVAAVGAPEAPVATSSALDLGAALVRYDGLLLAGWVAASVALLLLVGASALAFAVRRRGWREADVDGHRVLLTTDVGPAVVGLLRGRIVLPEWALAAAPRLRALMLAHEAEHVRAGDPRLLAGGLLMAALMPWNPAVWWQLRRLRLAIEVDCDARVLRAHPDARAYGALLLEMGARHRARPLLAAAAFSEPRTTLETRIRRMTERTPRARWARIGLFAALGLGAAVAAAFAPAPDRPLQLPGESAAAGQEHASGAEVLAPTPDRPGVMLPAPSDTPPAAPTFTDAPRLLAAKAVRAMLADQYPPLLREAGIGGSATVWIHVGATGAIEDARLDASSGYDALDQAALRVASGLRFRPALDGNDAVAIWLPLRVVFGAGDGLRLEDSRGVDLTDPALQEPPDAREAIREMQVEDARVRERLEELAARARAEAPDTPRVPPMAGPTPQERLERLRAGPQFTPFSTPPTLRNRSEVSGLLETYYPPLLKDAGIQGGADVWLFIDADGTVLKAQLNASSGYQALDEAAVRVAHEMAFDPALNRDDPVPVWVSLKIEFKNR